MDRSGGTFVHSEEPNVLDKHCLLILGIVALALAVPFVGLAADGGDAVHCSIDSTPISTVATWLVGAMAVLAFCVRRR